MQICLINECTSKSSRSRDLHRQPRNRILNSLSPREWVNLETILQMHKKSLCANTAFMFGKNKLKWETGWALAWFRVYTNCGPSDVYMTKKLQSKIVMEVLSFLRGGANLVGGPQFTGGLRYPLVLVKGHYERNKHGPFLLPGWTYDYWLTHAPTR